MLHSVKAFHGFGVASTDGDGGAIADVYFDDARWVIRHIVIDTGSWFAGRKVLLSPETIREVDWERRIVLVSLTRQQIGKCPALDSVKPVSQQHEHNTALWDYTGWRGVIEPKAKEDVDSLQRARHEALNGAQSDPGLRSSREVIDYNLEAADEPIGHVEDFLFDDKDWSIQFMVVDTRRWWPGKHVLVATKRIRHVSYHNQNVVVSISREQVEKSPEYDAEHPPVRETQYDLYRYLGKPSVSP